MVTDFSEVEAILVESASGETRLIDEREEPYRTMTVQRPDGSLWDVVMPSLRTGLPNSARQWVLAGQSLALIWARMAAEHPDRHPWVDRIDADCLESYLEGQLAVSTAEAVLREAVTR